MIGSLVELPAITLGDFTVFAPFFIMQPAFGFGVAASRTSNPAQAGLRSLMNHAASGAVLYLFGLLLRRLPWTFAEYGVRQATQTIQKKLDCDTPVRVGFTAMLKSHVRAHPQ